MKLARAFHPLDPRAARTRLLYAAATGLLSWLVVPWELPAITRVLLAWDFAGLLLFAFASLIIVRADSAETRRRAAANDPGRTMVWLVVLGASAFSLLAATIVLRQGHARSWSEVALSVAAVVISWLVTHAAFTLRYAHLFYRDSKNEGGVEFPGGEEPDDLDFAYFAFTIGMCFQVSDAAISGRPIRRTALGHAMLSFLYNTVIVALALNLIVGQLG